MRRFIRWIKSLFTKKPDRNARETVNNTPDVRYKYYYSFPDVSHWKPVDYEEFKGFDLIFKATEGKSFVDSTFIFNMMKCKERGIRYGVYHFYRTNIAPEIQAKNFITTVGLDNLRSMSYLPVVDYETANGQTRKDLARNMKNLKIFIRLVNEQTGRKMRVYTGDSLMGYLKFDKEFTELCDNPWVARYSDKPPKNSGPWEKVWAWQYADNDFARGIGQCDMNRFSL